MESGKRFSLTIRSMVIPFGILAWCVWCGLVWFGSCLVVSPLTLILYYFSRPFTCFRFIHLWFYDGQNRLCADAFSTDQNSNINNVYHVWVCVCTFASIEYNKNPRFKINRFVHTFRNTAANVGKFNYFLWSVKFYFFVASIPVCGRK